MPELPEVEALAEVLREHAVGKQVQRVEVAALNVLKTYDPAVSALEGSTVSAVARHGKYLDLECDGLHLVIHLSRAGWLRWNDALPRASLRPGKNPLAVRVRLADDSGFNLTEAGTQKRLAVWVVRDPASIERLATLGPDPLDAAFTVDVLASLLRGSRQQIKGLLRDQSVIAGIGNAYSDEVLHAARLSPYKIASSLDEEQVGILYAAIVSTLHEAVERSRGLAASELKSDKKSNMRVHGRTGLPCPVCGDTIREVSFADSSLQYCPTCQTGGKPLADRRLSRLLK
jgi:formamidopyrimidine-DNA glycosylase